MNHTQIDREVKALENAGANSNQILHILSRQGVDKSYIKKVLSEVRR